MKQSTDSLKKFIADQILVTPSQIKRLKKNKNEKKEIERIFEIQLNESEVIHCKIITDPVDETITSFERLEELPPVKNKFSDYYFAIATEMAEDDEYFNVCIIRKRFWHAHHHCDDQPCPIAEELPSWISDLNESSDMAAYVDDWQEAYNELLALGMEYNNDLARFLQAHSEPNTYIQP